MGRSILAKQFLKSSGIILCALYLIGCGAGKNSSQELSGPQLWADHCSRCHNMPDPKTYDDSKWETVSMHMKLRANISNAEVSAIKDFLQSANEN